MVKVASYTKSGNKQADGITLSGDVFGVKATPELIQAAYNAYLANGRSAQPTTLTRGLVRGGGKKPWRQKGTGRARVGSIRVPNWRGGGVVFGPTGLENHYVQMPVKMKRQAIRQALSLAAKADKIAVIEEFTTEGKVKATVQLLSKLEAKGKILLVVADKTDLILRATNNLLGLTVAQAKYLNVFDVMNADRILVTKSALEQVEAWLGNQKPAAKPTQADAKPAAKPKAAAKTASGPKEIKS